MLSFYEAVWCFTFLTYSYRFQISARKYQVHNAGTEMFEANKHVHRYTVINFEKRSKLKNEAVESLKCPTWKRARIFEIGVLLCCRPFLLYPHMKVKIWGLFFSWRLPIWPGNIIDYFIQAKGLWP
jgi:hypothetical protein